MSCASVSTLGTAFASDVDATRCALFIAGNAGGASSSPWTVSESSSSSGAGAVSTIWGGAGASEAGFWLNSQFRR
ncbi:hypothetical protein BD414DRAFT_471508 [Trametes punicea]|nr:hypothetical protein BD414DRAFT_471508 [Trametes punicea]